MTVLGTVDEAMVRRRGYTFRLRGLSVDQQQAMTERAGQVRSIWNAFLRADLARRERAERLPGLAERNAALTGLRNCPDLVWLSEGSSTAWIQSAIATSEPGLEV